MKRLLTQVLSAAVALMAAALFALPEAEARRLGGGKSFGRQSPNVTQQQAAPQAPAAAPTAAARQPGAAAGGSRWMAPIAGLAAGLGLAALASYLGFGEALANFMMLALLVIAAIVVFRLIMSRRAPAGPRPAYQSGYSNASVGQEAAVRYSPLPAGAERGSAAPVPAVTPASTVTPAASWSVPADFDSDGFLRHAKVQFVRLQAAFDAGDLNDLREFTAPEMFAELKMQIDERRGAANRTDVVTLDAQLLGIETTDSDYVASVRFTGMIREEADGEAKPFDEVWNLVKPARGSGGWVLGGIQQLN